VAADFEVRGADDLAKLGRRLKEAGDKELRRELLRGLNRAVKPLTQEVKDSLDEFLPDNYAAELGPSVKVQTRKRVGGRNPSVSMVGRAQTRDGKPRNLDALNRGRLRHPLYGNRAHWFEQAVDPGWWEKPLTAASPLVRLEIERVINSVNAKLERGL
jgi:hypothetical protein